MNRHSFRWGSAVFGLLFAGIAGGWATHEYELVDAGTAGLTAAVTLIVVGALGVAATIRVARQEQRPTGAPPDHDDERLEEADADERPATTPHDDTEEAHDGQEEAPTQR